MSNALYLRAYAIACVIYHETASAAGFDELVDVVTEHIEARK